MSNLTRGRAARQVGKRTATYVRTAVACLLLRAQSVAFRFSECSEVYVRVINSVRAEREKRT